MTPPTHEVQALLRKMSVGELIELAIKQGGMAEPMSRPPHGFRREGETWELSFAGKTVYARDRLGLRYIARLLGNPHRSVGVVPLYLAVAGTDRAPAPPSHRWAREPGQSLQVGTGRADPELLADAPALAECHQRLKDIEAEVRQAQDDNDQGRLNALDAEREQVGAYLRACTGAGGRLRRAADVRERVRKSVSNAVTRAISAIFRQHEVLGRHLRNSIRSGYEMVYDPETATEWAL